MYHNASGSDFMRVLITFPGALLFCYRNLRGVNSYGSSAKLDSLKIISGAAFCIIGLTKISKIEFLPLDWIYRSI